VLEDLRLVLLEQEGASLGPELGLDADGPNIETLGADKSGDGLMRRRSAGE
jgi:hypothetical protein